MLNYLYLTFALPFSYSLRCFNIVQCLFLLGTVIQPKECIVCRARKTASSSSGYEDLVKCSTNPGLSSLISFSEGCLNKYIQAQLTGLAVEGTKAKEFYYHRSCQREITREHGNIDKAEVNSHKECFDVLVHVFFYKHNVYKHTQPQFCQKNKHILSIFTSLWSFC